MAKTPKNASVLQILVISYFLITVPAALLAFYILKAVENELAIHVAFVESGEPDLMPDNPGVLVSFGAFLREHSLPLSKTDDEYLYPYENSQLHEWTENLYKTRAALIYSWVILILFGGVVYISLATNIQRIFKSLITAIDGLRKYNSTDEIRLDGPFDLSDLSTSLENLRLKMTHRELEQQRFLRHISHEIKTPLTSIKEGSKLLDDQMLGQMNNEQREIANILVRSSAELQRAVESLLNYNAAIALRQVNHRRPVDLADLVKQALDNNELSIKQKRLLVNADLDICHGNIDQSQITTIFDNLISNAVKHSPVEETLEITLRKNKSRKITFIIKDQGPGISELDKSAIFDPFYVGNQATETTLKGTGLGLSIAKQYIEEHNGSISLLKSRKGAVFKVVLPSN